MDMINLFVKLVPNDIPGLRRKNTKRFCNLQR